MAATVRLEAKVAQLAGSADETTVTAANVREALHQLARVYPALGARLFNCDGDLRSVFRILINGQIATSDTKIQDGDVLLLELA